MTRPHLGGEKERRDVTMAEWQPIETAPKDGRLVLIAYRKRHKTNTYIWEAKEGWFVRIAKWDDGSWLLDAGGQHQQDRYISSWQPLPEPPTA